MDMIIKKFKERFGNDKQGDILAYADDIACWSNNRPHLKRALECWKECFEEAGVTINVAKTEILTVKKQNDEVNEIVLGGEQVKEAEVVKYLGCIFTKEGDKNKREITERISKYSRCVCSLYPVLKDRYIPLEAKRTIFQSILTPILTYASESWTLTNRDWSRVQAAEMRTLRAIVDKTKRDRIRNETIREMVGVTSVRNVIENSQLRCLGHVERMDGMRTVRRRWNWLPDGRRSVGRPRKRWRDGVEELLERRGIDNIEALRDQEAFERTNWRRRLIHLTG